MITPHSVHRRRAGIERHAQVKSPPLHPVAELDPGLERPLGRRVPHELDAVEEAPPADVADVFLTRQRAAEFALKQGPDGSAPLDEAVPADDPLHGQRARAAERVRLVRVAVVEHARPAPEPAHHLLVDQHPGDGRVPAPQPFADGHDVRDDVVAFLLEREEGARAAGPAHDFVEDQQDAVPGAEAAHGAEVARWGGHAAGRGADDGLGDEGDDGRGVQTVEFGVEFRDEALHVLRRGLVRELVLVRVRGADVRDGRQQERLVGDLPREVARERDGAQGGAVPALLAGDEVPARRLPAFEKVLPGKLHGRLHGFAAAADEEGLFQPVRVPGQDDGCEVFG